MTRVSQQSVENEFRGHIAVDSSDDDRRDQNEHESALSSPGFREGTDHRRSSVLTEIFVSDRRGDAEEDKLHDRQSSEGFREIFRIFHFRDERWVKDLSDEKKGDTSR